MIAIKQFLLSLVLISFSAVHAQKKDPKDTPKATFDCAKADNTILAADAANCKTMVLTGSGNYEKVKIISANISISMNGSLKQFVVNYNSFSKELIQALNELKAGSKITIDGILVSVPDAKTDKNTVRKLENITLKVN